VIVPPGLRRVEYRVTTSCSSKSAKHPRSEMPEASIFSAFGGSPAYRRKGVALGRVFVMVGLEFR